MSLTNKDGILIIEMPSLEHLRIKKMFSYGFRDKTIFYRTAKEFGYKCASEGTLTELGGNPYDPNNFEYDDFLEGVRLKRKEDSNKLK